MTTPATSLPYPPGPSGAKVLSQFFRLAANPLQFMADSSAQGPVVRVPIGRERLVFVTDPALIHELLVGRYADLVKDIVTQRLTEVLGNGLVTSEGSFWRGQRKLIAPLFNRKHLAVWASTMSERTEVRVARWQDGATLDLHHEMMALTLDIIFATVFGTETGPDDAQRIGHALDVFMTIFERELRTWHRFVPKNWLRGARRQAAEARDALDSLVYAVIDQRTAEGATGDDLVSRLLAARGDDGAAMSRQQVRDEAVTMVVAGHETTALVLTYASMLLSDHPDVVQTFLAELDTVLQGRTPQLEDVANLPFTRAVILEAMRLYPPAYTIGRHPLHTMEVGGYRVDPSDAILIPQWALHRRAEWFPEPETFQPARWLDGLEQRLPEHAYMPFGGGPRVCVGQHFAMLETQLCLAAQWQRVTVQVDPAQDRELSPAVTIRPRHGMKVRVTRRAG